MINRTMACIIVLACTLLTNANADTYPQNSVTIVVPFAAGGSVDIVGRLIAEGLQKKLGQPFIISNRSGANSRIGTQYVAKAKPDGYTLLLYSGSFLTNPSTQKNLPYDTLKDFSPVAMLGENANVLLVSTKLGVNGLQDFIKLAKEHPGKLTYGSSGVGGSLHLAGELLQDVTKIELHHVPYKGTGEMFPDLISGVIDSAVVSTASGIPFVKAGQIKALAITSAARVPSLPDVPTFTELGIALRTSVPYGIVAPAGTPPEVIARLSQAISEILDSKDLKERFSHEEIQPIFRTPTETTEYIHAEITHYADIVKKAGIESQ